MPYKITRYTYKRAKALNVIVKPSRNKSKKIDVFDKKGKKLASVGAMGYGDYPTFLKKKGKTYAETKRKAYKARHIHNRKVPKTPGFYADKLLW